MYLQPFGKSEWELILREGVRKWKVKHWLYLKVYQLKYVWYFPEAQVISYFFKKFLTRRSRIHRRKLPWFIKEFSNILTVKQHYSRSDFNTLIQELESSPRSNRLMIFIAWPRLQLYCLYFSRVKIHYHCKILLTFFELYSKSRKAQSCFLLGLHFYYFVARIW